MPFLKKFVKFLSALNTNASKGQMAAGFACGVLMALLPAGNLLWVALFILLSFFKIHSGTMLLTTALLKLAYRPVAPLADALGWSILDAAPLQGFFTALYDAPLVPLTRFNNSLVMGGLALGLLAWIPFFILAFALIGLYRAKLAPRVKNSKLYKAFAKAPLVQKLISLGGKAARAAGGGN